MHARRTAVFGLSGFNAAARLQVVNISRNSSDSMRCISVVPSGYEIGTERFITSPLASQTQQRTSERKFRSVWIRKPAQASVSLFD